MREAAQTRYEALRGARHNDWFGGCREPKRCCLLLSRRALSLQHGRVEELDELQVDELLAPPPLVAPVLLEDRGERPVLPVDPWLVPWITFVRPYLAHFSPVFSRFLRVFTVSTRRF